MPNVVAKIVVAVLMLVLGNVTAPRATLPTATAQQSVTAIRSVRDGPWSKASTWSPRRVPRASDVVSVLHDVRLDRSAAVTGMSIRHGGTLAFPRRASRRLTSTGNVIVSGTLRMRPTPARVHRLVFAGIDERLFVGGGDDVAGTDVGLWIRHGGHLAAAGAPKTDRTRATASIPAGATRFRVRAARGWRRGDELALGPTHADERANDFEVFRIRSVRDRRVTLSGATSRAHDAVALPDGRVLRPEVLNLTRNVRIEGTPGGRTHIHIHGAGKQTIRNVALRHMGVPVGGSTTSGRYALHFHHSGNATRGSLVDGVVARDVGTHAFVAHGSHGITFNSTIAYDFDDAAYWWDVFEEDGTVALTHDTVWRNCVAANGAQWGFVHAFGLRNTMDGCWAYGIDVTSVGSAGKGFAWDAEPTNIEPFRPIHTVWKWRDGIAHNVGNPLWIWQIDPEEHNIIRPTAYWPLPLGDHRMAAHLHGAYLNNYHYVGGVMMGDIAFELHAASARNPDGRRQVHRRMIYDAAGGDHAIRLTIHELASQAFGLIDDCRILNYSRAAVVVNEQTSNRFSRGADYTFRDCTTTDGSPLVPADFVIEDLHPESEICIQNGDEARMIDGAGAVFTVQEVTNCP
ncbi:MAG: hypothetical protein ACRDKT_03750 [Actinomycetota bacterium]